jgi:hypothetical protein
MLFGLAFPGRAPVLDLPFGAACGPWIAARDGQLVHRLEVRQLLAHGADAGGEYLGPFG